MSEETKTVSSDIKKLGDSIVALTLMQAKELVDYLKDEHGIEAAAGGAEHLARDVDLLRDDSKVVAALRVAGFFRERR